MKHIDEFFKKQLESFKEETSVNLWRKLSLLLFMRKYGIWIVSGVLLSAILFSYLLFTPQVGNVNSSTSVETNVNIEIPTNPIDSQHLVLETIGETNFAEKIVESETLVSKEKTGQNEIELKLQESEDSGIIKSNQESNPKDNQLISSSISNSASKLNKEIPEISYSSEYNPVSISLLALMKVGQFPLESLQPKSIEPYSPIQSNYQTAFSIEDEKNRKPSRSSRFAIDIFVNPTYVTQSLSASEEYNEHIQYREDSEEPMFATSLGAEIKYSLKNFFIQSGLNYSEYGQKYQYNSETYNYENGIVIDTTWIWIVDPPFIEPYPIAIDSTIVIILEQNKTSSSGRNQYNYLEIPLLVGYQLDFKKLNMEISTGISYGFFLSAKGELPDKANSSFSKLSEQSDIIENNVNYLLYLGVNYKLNDKWGLLIKPNYKHNLNSTFNKDLPVKQKFSTFGITFGIRINL